MIIKPQYFCALLAFMLVTPSHAIEFWHSGTVWAGQGMCSAAFTFDSEMQEIHNLKITASAVNSKNRPVGSNVMEIDAFGQSNADRYAIAYMEAEALCDDDLSIVVTQATATVDGKPVDLIKSKLLTPRPFRPFNIHIGNK